MHTNGSDPKKNKQAATRGTRGALDNIANKVSPLRRHRRFATRNKLRGITSVQRVRDCGQAVAYHSPFVHLIRDAHGRVRYAGLETCRRIWLCPVCAPRIGGQRSSELSAQCERWIKDGGAIWFLTLTFPHDVEDALKSTVRLAARGFTAILRGRAAKTERQRFDIAGFVRALEVTVGANGWHPHLHVLVFLKKHRGVRARREFQRAVFARFAEFVEKSGFRTPDMRNCPLVEATSAQVGDYVAKISGTAREMTMGHLKTGRRRSRSPMQVLEDATDGDCRSLRMWHEYELAMHGRRQLTYSRGLRRRLDASAPREPEGLSQEHTPVAANPFVGSITILPALWRLIGTINGLDFAIKEAFERGGYDAALAVALDGIGDDAAPGVVQAGFRKTEHLLQPDATPCDLSL
jgi:hypothetical protein